MHLNQSFRRLACAVSFVTLAAVSAPAVAQLPKPVITGAVQAKPVIYDTEVVPDYNGRVVLDLVGTGLGPDGVHPANGGGYVHLYVRGVSEDMRAGKWIECGNDPCFMYGATSKEKIHLGIRPDFYISQPGSHLQFRLFVTPNASLATDPSQDGTASPWSEVYTVDRAAAGAVYTPPDMTPVLTRLSPDTFTQSFDRSKIWELTVTGRNICAPVASLVINDDEGAALPAEGNCGTAGSDSVLRFRLPERYRSPGMYVARLAVDGKISRGMSFEIKPMAIDRDATSALPGRMNVPVVPVTPNDGATRFVVPVEPVTVIKTEEQSPVQPAPIRIPPIKVPIQTLPVNR